MALEAEESTTVPNLALISIVNPAFKELETTFDTETVKALRTAFTKVERDIPGVTQEIVSGILKSESIGVNMNEVLLRCACTDSDGYYLNWSVQMQYVYLEALLFFAPHLDFKTSRREKEFVTLYKKARDLKIVLSKIPAEIGNRQHFLQTIKDIASAIKELLDAVNEVFKNCQTVGKMMQYKKILEHNKKEFVKYSKSFSDTLKQYFKDGRAEPVFVSANRLINQTNNILYTFKLAGGS